MTTPLAAATDAATNALNMDQLVTLGMILGGILGGIQMLIFIGDRLWRKENPTDALLRQLIDTMTKQPTAQSVACGQQHQGIRDSMTEQVKAIQELAKALQEQAKADELRYERILAELRLHHVTVSSSIASISEQVKRLGSRHE